MRRVRRILAALVLTLAVPAAAFCQETGTSPITYEGQTYPLYAEAIAEAPQVPSPLVTEDESEIVACFTRDDRYFLIPVTMENGAPLDYRNDQWWGKGRQLDVDTSDFPTLARTALHSEEELCQAETITGRSIPEITRVGRPEAHSIEDFLGKDEDIVSVLKGDNDLVRRLGLTQPQCAKPLFHIFNVIMGVGKEPERGNVEGILYSGRHVHLSFKGAKG